MLFYMAKVPSGKTAANWDGSGNVWFKVWSTRSRYRRVLTWCRSLRSPRSSHLALSRGHLLVGAFCLGWRAMYTTTNIEIRQEAGQRDPPQVPAVGRVPAPCRACCTSHRWKRQRCPVLPLLRADQCAERWQWQPEPARQLPRSVQEHRRW
jgi:hypothetical protein